MAVLSKAGFDLRQVRCSRRIRLSVPVVRLWRELLRLIVQASLRYECDYLEGWVDNLRWSSAGDHRGVELLTCAVNKKLKT